MDETVGAKIEGGTDAVFDAATSASGKMKGVRDRFVAAGSSVAAHGRRNAAAADEFVRGTPWQAVAVSMLVGILVGALANTRR